MKNNGVPILSKAEIDAIGERFVQDFQPEVLTNPSPVDIEGFIEFYLGMTPDYQYLSHNGVYLGMTVFNDTNKVPVFDPTTNRAEYISAKARTVIIDNRLLDENQRHRFRFTLGHEGGHDIFHSGYFSYNPDQTSLFDEEFVAPMIQCRVDSGMTDRADTRKWDDHDWMEWQANHLSAAVLILQNEKYKGAALLQKCFTVDFLTKKRKVNEGEVPQYYVEHSHEPIITPEEFDKVQTELARRKRISRQYNGKSIFSSRIVCGDCGSYFGSKVWNSTSKYRRVIWQCNSKFKGEHKCETPHLDEETIKTRFVTALNAIIESKDNVLEDCRLMQATLTDCTGIDTEIESLLEEIDVVTELTKRCIAENSQTAQNQEEYAARYNGFVERYEKAKARLEQLRTTKAAREAQAEAIGAFMFEVQELDALTEFDEKLRLTIIDTITVHADERMTFKFQGGTEIEA